MDNEILRKYIFACIPTEKADENSMSQFLDYLLHDLIEFFERCGLYFEPTDFYNLKTDSICYREFNIWKRNLRFGSSNESQQFELFLDNNGSWCCLDPKIHAMIDSIQCITEAQLMKYIWENTPNPERDDALYCLSMGGFLLEDTLKEWKAVEEEYMKSPELFEDITKYDEDGNAYMVDSYNEKLCMPNVGYDCLEVGLGENWTRTTICNSFVYNALDYVDLQFDRVSVLLGIKKFVRRKI